jgi:putative copper resistance protein D
VFDPLVETRTLHFASTAIVTGGVLFQTFVGRPSVAPESACPPPDAQAYRRQVDRMVWIGLAAAIASGALWLVLLANDIGEQSWRDLFSNDTALVVLTATQFGQVWIARLLIGLFLLFALLFRARHGKRGEDSLRCFLAALLMGSLAWSGHAGGTPGSGGTVHRWSDFLHLVAAGAWLGGLLPLALVLRLSRRSSELSRANFARTATLRFSTLGQVAVATILVTGLVNTWALVGNGRALIETQYGRLLLVKVGLFVVMVGIAAFNRLRLAPMLPDAQSSRSLERNALTELTLGVIVITIVGMLGALPPAAHDDTHLHLH